MSEPHYQITYTATLEEMVETSLVSQARTKAIERGRKRGQLFMAGYLALLGTVVFMARMDQMSWQAFGVVLPIALILVGVPVYWLWGRYTSWCIRRGVAKIVAETWAGDGTPCENEFRDDQLCVKQHGSETRLSWSNLTEIEDGPDAVILWFGSTLARFPSRIFADDAERAELIRAARELGHKAT